MANNLPVVFISSYNGRADYGVYVRRLNRDIRIGISQDENRTIYPITAEITEQEANDCRESLLAFLVKEHEKFLEWERQFNERNK